MHDLWGADGAQGSEAEYPGDDGDWSNYDAFLAELIAGIQAADMLDGLEIDIWNEPDGSNFWTPSRDQYLAMWQRGYETFRYVHVVLAPARTLGQKANLLLC